MRKGFIVLAAITAASWSCGGNSSSMSKADAEAVASELSAALASAGSGANNQLTFTGSPVTYTCAAGGTITATGSVSINCPSGLRSCTTTGTLTVDAAACTTATGAVIDGSVTATVSGTGLSLTKTVTGEIDVTLADGSSHACSVDVTLFLGHLSGTVCGISVSK
jgi:hypothetical protein